MTSTPPMVGALQLLRRPWTRALRLWDQISIYLPILLMGALALGTYWLVRNSPVLSVPETAK